MQKKLNEDFIEEYSEQFATKISDDFFKSHSFINGQEILNISPSKQVNFFVIKLLFNNWQLESQRLESPFFDYTAPDVKEAMVQFMNVLSRHIKVGKKEFDILLQDAVRDTLFLIMAPNVYMEIEMDRKGNEQLTEKSAKSILKYLRVGKDAFSTYLLNNIGIDRDDIQLDDEVITDVELNEEIALLNEVVPITLQKLEEGEEDSEDELVEEEEVKIEEEEENMLNVSADDIFSTTVARSSEISVEEEKETLEVAIHQVAVTAEEEIVELEEEIEKEDQDSREGEVAHVEEEIESTSVLDMISQKEEEIEEEVDDLEDVEEDLEDEIVEEKDTGDSETDEPAIPVITNIDPDDEDEDEEEHNLNSRFEDPLIKPSIAKSHENQVESMMTAISVNHRFMFVNELFDGDPDVFKEAIDRVDASSSFDESVEILVQNYAKEYHWDMNSEEVKELLKIIFRRFR